jgi:hypothetical protein
MPNFSRVSALLAGLLFCIPTLARADMECLGAQMLRGPVKTAVVSSGKIVAGTGAIRNLHQQERIDISRDRRTASIVHYQSDGMSLWPLLNLWPTKICDFDDAGRAVLVRVKLNGLTTYERIEMTYDAQGRLVRSKSRSDKPEFTVDRTYDYRAYTVTISTSEHSVTRSMTKLDEEENRSWASAAPPIRDPACQYDIHGNWTRCVDRFRGGSPPAGSLRDLEVREIAYWP